MTDPDSLFGALPEQRAAERAARGVARLRTAQRDQLEFQVVDLDSLLPAEHPARAVWAFVEQMDLRPLLAAIKAREGAPGHPPADPKILMTLWLYATIEGIGSARALAGLCADHVAYRWICGGVSMNHHTLAAFRVGHEALLDQLLAQGVTVLVDEGLVQLEQLAQDGVRVRACAGSSSYRRRPRLESLRTEAEQRVAQLKAELEADPAASTRRRQAARTRAARERAVRVSAALERMRELEAERGRREQTHKKDTQKQKPPRASTTDAEARVMKMPDGGFRPAYNGHFASDPQTQVILAVAVDTSGSDGGLMKPMLDRIAATYGQRPSRYLVDGGFSKLDDIEHAYGSGTAVFAPPPTNKHKTDPFAPRAGDGPGVAAWRRRMASPEGKAVYRARSKAECVNADLRNRGFQRVLVRGRDKVRSVLLWFAVAHNLCRALNLRASAAAAV